MDEKIIEHEHFVTKINPDSPIGKSDCRLWDFCIHCNFVSLWDNPKHLSQGHHSMVIHLAKKHKISNKKENNMELEKEFLKHLDVEDDKELKEAIRDIITRYGRPTSQGGYSADFLTDQMYIYFYSMFIFH